MIQRKCGTCRYFEEGGIAASGWCKHPDRQELQHMVLVRKTELACRDGWDRDLWEARDTGFSEGTGSPPRELHERNRKAGVSESHQHGASATATRPRTSTEPAAESGDPSVGDDARPEFGTAMRPESPPPPRSTSEMDDWRPLRSRQSDLDEPADVFRDETISTRGARQDESWRQQLSELRESGATDFEPVPRPELFDRPSTDQRVDRRREHTGEAEGRREVQRRVHPGSDSLEAGDRFGARFVSDVDYGSTGPVIQSGETQPFEVPGEADEADITDPAVEPDYNDSDVGYNDADDLDISSPDPAGHGDSRLPMSVQEQKCCRTCRDFIPVDGGKRGWCNNRYAFEKRQQVDADQVSCKGTFGSWWAPADDWWLERADISHHSTPTPLVQELIRDLHDRRDTGSTSGGQRS